jgi:hypothetical protein
MPKERRDLTGNIIASKANWSPEEIMAWINYEEKCEEELEQQLQSEFVSNRNRHTLVGVNNIWRAIREEVDREDDRYII